MHSHYKWAGTASERATDEAIGNSALGTSFHPGTDLCLYKPKPHEVKEITTSEEQGSQGAISPERAEIPM